MSDAVVVALIVGIPAFFSPIILNILSNYQRHMDKIEDWKRQDEVAKKVDAVATKAEETASAQSSQLSQIHTLVNSDMTAARMGELKVTRLLLASLKKAPITDEVLLSIKEAEESIINLEAILADRAAQQKIVEAEQEAAKKK